MIDGQFLLVANTWTEVYRTDIAQDFNEMRVEVFICNQDGAQWSTLDVGLLIEQGDPDTPQYLYRGYSMRPSETKHHKLLLQNNDSIRVRVTTARVSVTITAEEVVTAQTIQEAHERVNERIDIVTEELQRIAAFVGEGVSL